MLITGLRPARTFATDLALDRATVRSIDKDGRLHVATSHISKATVNGYLGSEIPDYEALRLDPNRTYYLLRDPRELEKAVTTFNNLPILREHVPVNSEAPMQELVIGSTGTDAAFASPYLDNSAVIWCQDDIDDIEAERKCQWSCAYHYRADMTPGVFSGLRYDGIMRDIVGNHVALVDEGRAGPDVVVGDHLPGALKMLKSRRALMLSGAVAALVAPKIAQDKKLDLTSVLKGYSAKTKGDRDKLAGRIVEAVKPMLAQDGDVAVADVVAIIAAVEGAEDVPEAQDEITEAAPPPPGGEAPTAADGDDDALARVMSFLEGKLSEEDSASLAKLIAGEAGPAEDEDPDDKGKPPAMDAAAIARTVGRTVAELRDAERLVEPIIGKVTVAQDSAAAIYRLALDHAKVDHKGITDPKALRAMVTMIPKPDGTTPPVAMDHATVQSDFRARFPGAGQLVSS